MFNAVLAGIVTVEQALTAFRNCGASSPPLLVRVHSDRGSVIPATEVRRRIERVIKELAIKRMSYTVGMMLR